MKTGKKLSSILVVVALSFTACKKYPDGPMIDFHSKAERVANNWKVGQAFDEGKDVTYDYTKYELDLTKGGNASLTAKYKLFGTTYDFTTTGTWVFVSNKEKISFDFDDNNADGVYSILKLKEDEMWLKNSNEKIELHFVQR